MPRRASAARSAEMPALLPCCPADKRTRLRVGRDKGGFAGAVGLAAGATILRDVPVASVAELRFQIEAPASTQHLPIDHHCDEEQREIEQRELVNLPGGLGPFLRNRDTDDPREQNSA